MLKILQKNICSFNYLYCYWTLCLYYFKLNLLSMFVYLSLTIYGLFEFEYYVVRLFKSFLNLLVLEFKINIFFYKISRSTRTGIVEKKSPMIEIEDGDEGLLGGRGSTPRPTPLTSLSMSFIFMVAFSSSGSHYHLRVFSWWPLVYVL